MVLEQIHAGGGRQNVAAAKDRSVEENSPDAEKQAGAHWPYISTGRQRRASGQMICGASAQQGLSRSFKRPVQTRLNHVHNVSR